MTRGLPAGNPSEPDLIDRIAKALPADVRADYYRELRHCRSLPDNDEMLRILRAMQFLTLLTEQVPDRIGVQREKLDSRLRETTDTIQRVQEAAGAYHRKLDERLTALPSAIAAGISPGAIVEKIHENLRQQFIQSAIPQTAEALAAVAREMTRVAAQFGQTAKQLGGSYRGAAEDARRAVSDIESAVSLAAERAKRAADSLSWTFSQAYRWSIYTLCTIALLLGIGIGMSVERWISKPKQPDETSILAPAHPAPMESSKAKR
jgi:hypothetical protein